MPAIISKQHFKGVEVSADRRERICCFWTARNGVKNTERRIDEVETKQVGMLVLSWQDGRMHSMHPCAIRMNLALPLSRVQEAFDRFAEHVFC